MPQHRKITTQNELTQEGSLLDSQGNLAHVGWARRPLLNTNLEEARSRLGIKKWDYYCLFLPTHVVAFALADLTYAGSAFCYLIDRKSLVTIERAISLPGAMGVSLARNSDKGISSFRFGKVTFDFTVRDHDRLIQIHWPKFAGKDLKIDVTLSQEPDHESMAITTPMGPGKFYWNRKINNLRCSGLIQWGDLNIPCDPTTSLATFDWGRGIWPFQTKWVWSNASGFLPSGEPLGINIGTGFGENIQTNENSIIFDGRIHKLEDINFHYHSKDRMRPWQIEDSEGRLKLVFTPSLVRTGKTDLLVIKTHVDQMFGVFNGSVQLDSGQTIEVKNLWGFAEEHFARW